MIAGLLLILALPALADLEYATSPGAQPLPEATLREGFRLDIEDGGMLLLPNREALTLAQFEQRLRKARAAHDARQGTGVPGNSKLPVLLHVDRRAPWWHVQIVLAAAGRAGCPNVHFAVDPKGAKFVRAALPPAWEPQGVGTRTEVTRFLSVVATASGERTWPEGGEITQPTAARYLLRGTTTPLDPAAAREIADRFAASQGKSVICRGVVAAEPAMPFGLVVAAVSVFGGERYAGVEFAAPTAVGLGTEGVRLPFPGPIRRGNGDPGPVDGGVRVPLAPVDVDLERVDPGKVLVLDLDRCGRIRVGGQGRSLSGLLLLLAPGESNAPRRVALRADGAAPWQHVAHLLTALQRRGIERVEFVVRREADRRDAERDALIFGVPRTETTTKGENPERLVPLRLIRRERPRNPRIGRVIPIRHRLELVAEREVESTFGPAGGTAPAMRPLNVRMKWDDRVTYSAPQLRTWIRESEKRRIGDTLFWESGPKSAVAAISEKVPARHAIAALVAIAANEWDEIYFFAPLEQEDSMLLGALAMPYPRTNRLLSGSDGSDDE